MSVNPVVSIPQWAEKVGLADDGRSIAAARELIAKGQGPEVAKVGQREGVPLRDDEVWIRSTPWAAYLAALTASEREQRNSQAMRIVGAPAM